MGMRTVVIPYGSRVETKSVKVTLENPFVGIMEGSGTQIIVDFIDRFQSLDGKSWMNMDTGEFVELRIEERVDE
jgi:hypothetical protein